MALTFASAARRFGVCAILQQQRHIQTRLPISVWLGLETGLLEQVQKLFQQVFARRQSNLEIVRSAHAR